MYGDPDPGSAAMPETRMRRATPAATASRDRLGAVLVHGLEGHAAILDIGRDRVDDSVGPGDGPR
jgi:hypothetical protein